MSRDEADKEERKYRRSWAQVKLWAGQLRLPVEGENSSCQEENTRGKRK